MRLTITFLIVLFSTVLCSSAHSQVLILSRDQNNKWLESLSTLPVDEKLSAIKSRLLSDTAVFVKQFYSDRIKVADSLGNRVYGDGKPTLVIGGHAMIIDNRTEPQKIISLLRLLSSEYIDEITVLNPNETVTQSLYGSAGQSGIILMTLTKRKYNRLFKRLELKSNY